GLSFLVVGVESEWLSVRGVSGNVVEELAERGGHTRDLDGAIAADGPWSSHETGTLARQNWQFAVHTAIEANNVVRPNVQQLADSDCRRAQLDREGQPRAADPVGEFESVVFRAVLARRRREPGLGIQAVHKRL